MKAIIVDYDVRIMSIIREKLEKQGFAVEEINAGCGKNSLIIGSLARRIMTIILACTEDILMIMSKNFTAYGEIPYREGQWSEVECLQLLQCLDDMRPPANKVSLCIPYAIIPDGVYPPGWTTENLIKPTEFDITQ